MIRKRSWVVAAYLVLLMLVPSAGSASPDPVLVPCTDPAPPEPSPAWMAAMPKPVDTEVTVEDVIIPVAGGSGVSARVYRPTAYDEPLPTILNIAPSWSLSSGKELEDAGLFDATDIGTALPDCFGPFFLRRGYAVVLADMVGTHESGGCFDLGGPRDQAAGYATVEWIADQGWSNGRVGMHGLSFDGLAQYATAVAAPPALRAIAPTSATFYYELVHPGAVLSGMALTVGIEVVVDGLPAKDATSPDLIERLASNVCDPDYVRQVVSLDGTKDAYWRARDFPAMAGSIDAAVLHAVGSKPGDNIRGFGQMWSALEKHEVPRKGLIGPWGHNFPAVPGWLYTELRWDEHWVRGNDTGMMNEPSLTLIDQAGVLRTAETFPSSATAMRLLAGGGQLDEDVPQGTATYVDVPQLPHGLMRHAQGARLIYRSAPFGDPTRISGAGALEVVASIDTTDTNFAAYVYDVDENDIATPITWGYLDARHRISLEHPGTDVVPNAVERYKVELSATEYTVARGHRLELILSSSDDCLSSGLGFFSVDPECQWHLGLVSDTTKATVMVHEGPGMTQLLLPVASKECTKPRHSVTGKTRGPCSPRAR